MIFRTGIRINGELVRLLYLQDKTSAIKIGYAVGKKLGKAHVRTRGRRIMREAFRQLAAKENITSGLQVVISLNTKGLNAKTQDILRELENLFRRKKLLTCYPESQSL